MYLSSLFEASVENYAPPAPSSTPTSFPEVVTMVSDGDRIAADPWPAANRTRQSCKHAVNDGMLIWCIIINEGGDRERTFSGKHSAGIYVWTCPIPDSVRYASVNRHSRSR